MSEEKKTQKGRPPSDKRIVAPLVWSKVKPAEILRNLFATTVAPHITLEDLQESSFWTNLSKHLHVSARIEVTREDGAFFAEFYVTRIMGTRVDVKLLRHVDLSDTEDTQGDGSEYEVMYRGQVRKHVVQRKDNKEIVKDGFNSNAEAKQYLINLEIGSS